MRRLQNLEGETFGLLTVISYAGSIGSTHRKSVWNCICKCGTKKLVIGSHLKNSHTKSCGCFKRHRASETHTKHDASRTPEYSIYHEAKRRCINPNSKDYPYYGGRGIKFKFKSFEDFISHIGWRPKRSLSLDRINNNGHYEPGNVRWATKYQQTHNRRRRQ